MEEKRGLGRTKKRYRAKTLTEITSDIDYVKKLKKLIGVEMEDLNWEKRKEKFEAWAIKTVKKKLTINSYIKNSMNKKIPKKLIELKEKDDNFKSIFQITDISELKSLYSRLINDDLINFNKNTYSGEPSAAINKYIEFLKYTKSEEKVKQPLNQILYGPPGTGKTYNTINKSIEIIEERILSNDEDRSELM